MQLKKLYKNGSLMILCGLICLNVVLSFNVPAAASDIQETQVESDISDQYSPSLEISHSSDSAIVLETGRMRILYQKNAGMLQNIPVASKIMTALIACERLPLDTQVTISRVAADAEAGRPSRDGIVLATGDKYPLEYLLLRLFFYDSDSAAIAIAEQISNVEEQFVELMNNRAGTLEMSNTVFRNATGDIVFDDSAASNDQLAQEVPQNENHLLQYSTTEDVARLISIAMLDQNFSRLIRKESEYLVIDGQRLVSMQNQISQVWTLSERMIQGAFYSERNNRTSMTASGRFNDINVIIVTAGGQPTDRINDLIRIIEACSQNYISDTLVEAGERFTGDQEQTLDGESFGLLFRKTVYYVRPVNDLFLKETIKYNSFGPHNRPIQRSLTVGQVIFELKDGSTIAVDVGPDRQILSDITLLDHALNQMQNNPNLSLVLLISAALLLLAMAWQIIRNSIQIIRLLQLIYLEKRLR